MGRTKNPAKKLVTDRYLAVTKPFFSQKELANHLDVGLATVYGWDAGHFVPGDNNARNLGILAATITFLRTELSFGVEDTANYLRAISLDPQTYQPVTALDLIKAGDAASVIQHAIELSVEE